MWYDWRPAKMIEKCLNVKHCHNTPDFPGLHICEVDQSQWHHKGRWYIIPIAKQSSKILKEWKTAHQGIVPQPIIF